MPIASLPGGASVHASRSPPYGSLGTTANDGIEILFAYFQQRFVRAVVRYKGAQGPGGNSTHALTSIRPDAFDEVRNKVSWQWTRLTVLTHQGVQSEAPYSLLWILEGTAERFHAAFVAMMVEEVRAGAPNLPTPRAETFKGSVYARGSMLK